jgi:hypothetical protein
MDLGYQLQTTFFFPIKKFNVFNAVYGNTSSSLSESRAIHRKITVKNAAFSMLCMVVRIVTTELGRVKISRCVPK